MQNLNVLLKNKSDDNLYPQTKASLVLLDGGGNLGSVEAGAQVNKIESITVNGVQAPITNKIVQITTITQKDVEDLIAELGHISYEVVSSLPTSNIIPNVIYLVPSNPTSENDIYDQYLYVNNKWEKIGNTQADFSNIQQQITENKNNISTLNTTTIPNLQTQIDAKMNAAEGVYNTTL